MLNNQILTTLSIASGQSLSTPLWLGDRALTAIRMPAAWDAAGITFQSALNGDGAPGVWFDLFDATGSEVAAVVAASRHVAILPHAMRGLLWIRLRSGTAAAPVNQSAARDLIIVHGGV